jgi:ferrous iron transport protein B
MFQLKTFEIHSESSLLISSGIFSIEDWLILDIFPFTNSLTDISDYSSIGEILKLHGWNIVTVINVMIFTVLHFPCTTTLLTIKKETGSLKWTLLSFSLPTVCGIILCIISNFIFQCFF